MNASQLYKEAQASINTLARAILGGFNAGYFETDNNELQHQLHELQEAFNQALWYFPVFATN